MSDLAKIIIETWNFACAFPLVQQTHMQSFETNDLIDFEKKGLKKKRS